MPGHSNEERTLAGQFADHGLVGSLGSALGDSRNACIRLESASFAVFPGPRQQMRDHVGRHGLVSRVAEDLANDVLLRQRMPIAGENHCDTCRPAPLGLFLGRGHRLNLSSAQFSPTAPNSASVRGAAAFRCERRQRKNQRDHRAFDQRGGYELRQQHRYTPCAARQQPEQRHMIRPGSPECELFPVILESFIRLRQNNGLRAPTTVQPI